MSQIFDHSCHVRAHHESLMVGVDGGVGSGGGGWLGQEWFSLSFRNEYFLSRQLNVSKILHSVW